MKPKEARMRSRRTISITIAVVGLAIISYLAPDAANADSGASTVAAVVEGVDTASNRGVLIVTGKKVSKFRSASLLDSGGSDAGTVELLSKAKTELTIGLPAGLAPGQYTLVLSPKKGDVCEVPITYRKTYALSGATNEATSGNGLAGTTSGLFAGVFGRATNLSGFSAGVQGENASDFGAGVYATADGNGAVPLWAELGGGNGNIAVFSRAGAQVARVGSDGSGHFNGGLTAASGSFSSGLTAANGTFSAGLTVTSSANVALNVANGIFTVGNGFSAQTVNVGTQGGSVRLNVNGPRVSDTTLEVTAADDNDVVLACLDFAGTDVLLVRQGGLELHKGDASKPGGGSWAVLSDRRLKKDVRDLDGALGKLLELRSVTFEYKDHESIHELPGRHVGFVAQEVEAVFPEWVGERKDGLKFVSPKGVTALTVAALRELRAEKDEQIEALRAENEELRRRLAEVEASHETRLAAIEKALAGHGEATASEPIVDRR
jgi:hypothetical protein